MDASQPPQDPAAPPAPADAGTFGGATPVLRVRDVAASVAHYVAHLGFALDWQDATGFASVSRGDCRLFLCAGDQGHPGSWVWVGVGSAQAAHDELRARGATIRTPPTNFAWAHEVQVEDLDGNVLRLASDPLPDVPYGPWLDMDGVRWACRADGTWARMEASPDVAPDAVSDATAESPAVAAPVAAPPDPALDVAARARALKSEGEQARRAHDLPQARARYEEAVALQRTLDDPLELAHTIRHLGDVLHDAREPGLADPHYAEALALYRAHPAPPPLNLANAIRSLAVLREETGDHVSARRLWEEASRLYQQSNVREGVAESAGWAARLAWRAGDLARARDWLAAARAASDASDDPATWQFVRAIGLELGG